MTRIGNVLYAAEDLDAAIRFYRDVLGLALKFRDGDRFAAFDGGGVTFALAGAAEDVTGGVPAVSWKVEDVAATAAVLTAAGATLVHGPADGPHETRAVLRDPAGNPFVLYAPRA
ncbi:VOC family protein [Actinomadura atramentaria]|uniref:VOC family protein n=1 Tax=Actinomadura atramentaria TaxID=1990 RepID=UPI00037FA3AD|nr:VOC family protein [Actinomadura atramentaria]